MKRAHQLSVKDTALQIIDYSTKNGGASLFRDKSFKHLD